MKILIIGGSGFVSGTLARMAISRGDEVWTVTRGEKQLPDGVIGITADRKDSAGLELAVGAADTDWDLAVDCIGFDPDDAREDVYSILPRSKHLIFVSTDFVYDPARRTFPQAEDAASYATEGYGALKRDAELVFESSPATENWTVLRPCHIYGPGSKLGCLPYHSRDDQIISRIDGGEPLTLAGGGHFLQEPLYVEDLASVILALGNNPSAFGKILNVSGPDCIESRDYYSIIASSRGKEAVFAGKPVQDALGEHPEWRPFLCHRFYDKTRLAGLASPPATGIEEGLQRHVDWLVPR